MKLRARHYLGFSFGLGTIGAVLGMRSLASWRPHTIVVLPDKQSWLSHVSDNGQDLIFGRQVGKKGTDAPVQYTTWNLETGNKIKWPLFTGHWRESGYTERYFWRVWEKPKIFPPTTPNVPDGEIEADFSPRPYRLDLFEIKSGRLIKTLRWKNRWNDYFETLQVRQNGRTLRLLSQRSVMDWDLQSDRPKVRVQLQRKIAEDEEFLEMAFASDTEMLGAKDLAVTRWNARTGKIMWIWSKPRPASGGSNYSFSADGRIAICNNQQAKFFRFYDARNGKVLWETWSGAMFGVTFSPRGDLVFVLKKDGCEVREALSGRLIRRLRGPVAEGFMEDRIIYGDKNFAYTQNRNGQVLRWRVS